MQIQVTFDSSVDFAPFSFRACVNAACQFYDTLFTNNVSISISVGYGEIGGQPLSANALGNSSSFTYGASYQQVRDILASENAPGASSLPAASPLPAGSQLYVTQAQAKALGISPIYSGGPDGYVGFATSNTFPLYFSPLQTGPVPRNETDFLSTVEHEVSEVMGRTSLIDASGANFSVMDLYRYQAPGLRQLTTGAPSYFSLDGGKTDLKDWNNPVSGDSGDLGDWAGGITSDSYDANGANGVLSPVSTVDKQVMAAIGWTLNPNWQNLTVANAIPTVTAANAVSEINAQTALYVYVTDTASHVAANLDALQTLEWNGNIGGITLSDGGTPTLTLAGIQVDSDAFALSQISGSFLLDVTTATANLTLTALPGHANLASFANASGNYSLSASGGVVTVTDTGTGRSSTDHLTGFLQIQFTDKTVTVAATSSTNEQIALLYQAALGRPPDPGGLLSWENLANALPDATKAMGVYGLSDASGNYNGTLSIAAGFTHSAEFIAKYGNLTDAQFVTRLYANILDRAPDSAGFNSWMSELSSGQSREHVLVGFAESAEAISNATHGYTGSSGAHASWLFLT